MDAVSSSLYKGHRYPAEIISHCVWLYHRFPLSFREVEEMMMARGVIVSYETIRAWCVKFGQAFANHLRRRRPRPGDKWYLDEVFIKINGKAHYLWRAVDQDGNVLDILVTSRRDAKAATRFFRKLSRDCGACRVSWSLTSWPATGVACQTLLSSTKQPDSAPQLTRYHPQVHETVHTMAIHDVRSTGSLPRFAAWCGIRI
jgi:putative transposase